VREARSFHLRLSGGYPIGARFDAVAGGIADEVKQRLQHSVDDELVDLRALAVELR
jgi:hypothetical protein